MYDHYGSTGSERCVERKDWMTGLLNRWKEGLDSKNNKKNSTWQRNLNDKRYNIDIKDLLAYIM
jgi:hypothetical protein